MNVSDDVIQPLNRLQSTSTPFSDQEYFDTLLTNVPDRKLVLQLGCWLIDVIDGNRWGISLKVGWSQSMKLLDDTDSCQNCNLAIRKLTIFLLLSLLSLLSLPNLSHLLLALLEEPLTLTAARLHSTIPGTQFRHPTIPARDLAVDFRSTLVPISGLQVDTPTFPTSNIFQANKKS